MNILKLLLSGLVLLIGSVAFCSDNNNPPPCTEKEWTCVEPPSIISYCSGDKKACLNVPITIVANGMAFPGIKKKCDVPADVGLAEGPIWDWVCTNGQSGNGNTAVITPVTIGVTTVTFTAYARAGEPCNGYLRDSCSWSFSVPPPSCSLSVQASGKVCPGKGAVVSGTITNTAECEFTYAVSSANEKNDDGLWDYSNFFTLAPGASGTITFTVSVAKEPNGDKIVVPVNALSLGSGVTCSGKAIVEIETGSFDPSLDVTIDIASLAKSATDSINDLIDSTVPFLVDTKSSVTGQIVAKGGRKCCKGNLEVFVEGGGAGKFSVKSTLAVPGLVVKLPKVLTKERKETILGYSFKWKPDFKLGLTGSASAEGAVSAKYRTFTNCDNCITVSLEALKLSATGKIGGSVGGTVEVTDKNKKIEANVDVSGEAGWSLTTGVRVGSGGFKIEGGGDCPAPPKPSVLCYDSMVATGGYSATVSGGIKIGGLKVSIPDIDWSKSIDFNLYEGTCK